MFGLGTIISGLSNVLSMVSNLVPTILKIVGPALEKIGKAFEAFFHELGLIEKDETVEEIGDHALQAEQDKFEPITIENFDSYEKYLEAVKKYELNSEKSALIPADEKLHKGLEILLGLAIAQYGQSMGEFGKIVLNNPDFYSKFGRLAEMGSLAKTDNQTFSMIVDYIENKNLSTEQRDSAFNKIVEMEKKINPDASNAEIWSTVSEIKNVCS